MISAYFPDALNLANAIEVAINKLPTNATVRVSFNGLTSESLREAESMKGAASAAT